MGQTDLGSARRGDLDRVGMRFRTPDSCDERRQPWSSGFRGAPGFKPELGTAITLSGITRIFAKLMIFRVLADGGNVIRQDGEEFLNGTN